MSIKIQIDSGIRDAKEIGFFVSENIAGPLGIPSGKILTDSQMVLSSIY